MSPLLKKEVICSHLNGVVDAQGEILQCRLRDGARPGASAFLQPLSMGCPIDSSSASGAWEAGQQVALGAQPP